MPVATLSRDQARRLDRRAVEEFGLLSAQLMENAGRGAVDRLCTLGISGPVVICCGKGNNGGDGFVMARHLELRGHAVRVLLFADPAELAGDAALNHEVIRRAGLSIVRPAIEDVPELLRGAAWIVDALLGTGAVGEVRPPLDSVIDAINAAGGPILAVDLPSGLDCDTGRAAGHTVRAAQTCTFVAAKPGFFAAGAARYTGEVHVADIGAPKKLVDEILGRQSETGRAE